MTPAITYHEILINKECNIKNWKACDIIPYIPTSIQSEEPENPTGSNGLNYVIPEILGSFYLQCENSFKKILPGNNYQTIIISPPPLIADKKTSIDPYFILENSNEN